MFDEFVDRFYVSLTGRPENGPIFVVKENNVTSEQTFAISFLVIDSAPTNIQSATIDHDYRHGTRPGQRSTLELFQPFEQRIIFLFELFADTLPEGTEAFQVSVSPEGIQNLGGGMVEQFPTSLMPLTLSTEVFVTIVDCKFKPFVVLLIIFYLLSCVAIIIGFTNTSYTVDEGVGTLQVDVQVFSPPDDQPLSDAVETVLLTVSGSASKCTKPVYLKILMLYIH